MESYEKFLEKLDKRLAKYFEQQRAYICCKNGCCSCCEVGEYPYSAMEINYLMKGFISLEPNVREIVKQNIKAVKDSKRNNSKERFNYKCPFLINNLCSVYKYRGITCRTHGLAYFDKDGFVKLPYCANSGLNFSEAYNPQTGVISEEIYPVKELLLIDELLKDFDYGEIKPLIDWFK